MEPDSLRALIEHQTAELRALFPQISDCHSALEQWSEGGERRHSLWLDIRWPQRQALVSGPALPDAQAAVDAAFRLARERIAPLPRIGAACEPR